MNDPGKPVLDQATLDALMAYKPTPLIGDKTDITFGAPGLDNAPFANGNFQSPDLAAAATKIGASIKKHGSPEFKQALGFDADGDGKVSRKENTSMSEIQIGATAIAASMNYFSDLGDGEQLEHKGIIAKFQNSFGQAALNNLNNPKLRPLIDAVAADIVHDNTTKGSPVNSAEDNKQLLALKKQSLPCGKCL